MLFFVLLKAKVRKNKKTRLKVDPDLLADFEKPKNTFTMAYIQIVCILIEPYITGTILKFWMSKPFCMYIGRKGELGLKFTPIFVFCGKCWNPEASNTWNLLEGYYWSVSNSAL